MTECFNQLSEEDEAKLAEVLAEQRREVTGCGNLNGHVIS